MESKILTIEEYIQNVSEGRKLYFEKLRKTIQDNIPEGFVEEISYGMLGYVVPHSLYPDGYHCSPELPLPFISIANQKGFIALYHMGIYADEKLLDWFVTEYKKHSKYKLDMGKSCIRFKRMDDIPYELIGDLVKKMSVKKRIEIYEGAFKNNNK